MIMWALIIFLVYTSFTSLFFSMRVLENDTMAPNLLPGERFLFSSYSYHSLFSGISLENGPLPFSRGSVVLVNMFQDEPPGLFYRILDGTLRFFTAQSFSLMERNENVYVKRVE
jgi:signal peptidase I